MPAVSIILPLYNGQSFIRHTLLRIRAQTFPDWELLVVDDGSADDGAAIVMSEARKDRRIRLVRKSNGGISSARNYGIAKASGKYLAFADQDDTTGRNWLAALMDGMAGDVDLAVGGKKLEAADASGRTVRRRICRYADRLLETETERYGFLFNQENDASSQHVWNCMYKKELVNAHGIRFDEQLAMGMEDVLFNICYGFYCKKIHTIPQVVYAYRRRDGTSTSTKYDPDPVGGYAHRMQIISRLSGFPSGSSAYRMYGNYALRELCNLYFRSDGDYSGKLLAGLRDVYVEHVPEPAGACGIPFGKSFFHRLFYAAAEYSLRKEKYMCMKLLKSITDRYRRNVQPVRRL